MKTPANTARPTAAELDRAVVDAYHSLPGVAGLPDRDAPALVDAVLARHPGLTRDDVHRHIGSMAARDMIHAKVTNDPRLSHPTRRDDLPRSRAGFPVGWYGIYPHHVQPGAAPGDTPAPAPEKPVSTTDLAARLEARHAGTKHSEANALAREAAALDPKEAARHLKEMGQVPGKDPRRQLAESILDRQATKVRAGLSYRPGSPDAAEYDALADEPLATADSLLGAPAPAPKKVAKPAKERAPKPEAPPAEPPATPAGQAVARTYDRAATATDAEIAEAQRHLATLPPDELQRVGSAMGMHGKFRAKDVLARITDRRGSAVRTRLIERPPA